LKESLEKHDKALGEVLDGKPRTEKSEGEPGVDDVSGEAAELYGSVGGVDAAPTAAQVTAGQHLRGEVREALEKWEQFKKTALPELNRKLNAAHLPPINLERHPDTMPEGGDED
jgi:hypothetical protein